MYYKFKLTSARTITQSSDVASIKNLALWIDATQDGAITNSSNLTNYKSVIIDVTYKLDLSSKISMYRNGKLTNTGIRTTASTDVVSSRGNLHLGMQKSGSF
ncbi:MAG: hypothetical protein FJ368_06690 [Pelagibacterales bacterium]|nr:hypothetical protein [Pelagibacterales bacterium]